MTTKNGTRKPPTFDTHIKGVLRKAKASDAVMMMVKRDSLKPADWNPDIRVQIRYLKNLRASMEEEGFWTFAPMLVDRSGTIIDGHRRWTVAKMLNIDLVPVIVVDDDADRIWAMYNGTRMDLTGSQAVQAVGQGLRYRPPKYAALLARLDEIVGEEGVREMGRRAASPDLLNTAIRLARYSLLDDDLPYVRAVIFWLMANKNMTVIAVRATREGVDPKVIERAVRGNEPLSPTYETA